jgi:hypothetical protein
MRPVSILTSGIGLGVYIPALLIERQMRAMGAAVEVETLESYYTPDGQQRHLRHKQAYHESFDLALLAHRMARGVEGSLDQPKLDDLLAGWAAQGRTDFVVCSGFWLPLLERYKKRFGARLRDCCHIDAVVSASFRAYPELARDATQIWLLDWQERKTLFEISVNDQPPLPFRERDHRLVVHGGGWGLGGYRAAYQSLADTSWAFDIVVHDPAEVDRSRPTDRYFTVDPGWRTWQRGARGHTFPPLAEVGAPNREETSNDHALFALIRRSKAIVSKPGGGTLLDSLSSATPVILLAPYGYAEERNGALWEHLGFGIPFAKWRATGASESVLAELHDNLLRRKRNGPDYPCTLVERMRQP